MKIFLGLAVILMIAVPSVFAQATNPAREYEQSRGTQPPVDGVWHVYDRDGNLSREENYHNYRLDGQVTMYYPSGAVKEVVHYSDGFRVGDDRGYYESGGLEHEDTYVSNDLEGPSTHYYDTGETQSRESYTHGNLDGEKKVYFKDGNLKQDMFYDNGLLDGDAYTYTEGGKIAAEEHYSHGKLVSRNIFSKEETYVSKNKKAPNAEESETATK